MNDLIPCLGSISFVLIVFSFFAFLRYMRHREILTLAEKGLVYPERRNGKDTLRWGIVITAIGLALIVGIAPVAWGNFWPLLLIGLLPAFFGLGLVLIYILTREPQEKEEEDVQVEEADTPES